nr:molybdate ABC transporter permease subunit [uncultured Oribacterium sp.]
MNELLAGLRSLDWSPLWISLKTACITTVICFFLGIFLAQKVSKCKEPWQSIVDSFLTLPMVLPPTVAGYFLLLLFSKRRPVGIFLFSHFGIKVVQSFLGCIIAATVISLPLMYRNAKASFALVPKDLVQAGRTLGMSEAKIFWRVILPLSGPGILSGAVLSFARALGEYGATSMLAGNIPGKTATISQRIALVMQDQDYLTAGVWVGVVLIISLFCMSALQLLAKRRK